VKESGCSLPPSIAFAMTKLPCLARMAADCFSLHGSGELSGIAFIPESEMHLWTTSIPHQRRRVVAGRFLLIREMSERQLRFC
jgi:hypothetical protein